ncbi:MazG family protein [Catellatospora tritici]|uniref:MazG family protein n=1 Tax=Catellatospora tritici TaxID=2851566 RepID=UPI001C2D5348|nr:MazG family protein [Catellatospora tritici]MBV1849647.1 MazG family protein [Catellatospora tritici]
MTAAGPVRRIVLLVTSPRIPAGLLTAPAWDLVRAHPVLAPADGEAVTALRANGAQVRVLDRPVAQDLLDAALAAPDGTVVWLSGPGGDEHLARELGLRLAREPGLAELELMYGSWDPRGARLLDAVAVTDRLQAQDPWRREQTHRTLAKYLLEEAYEAYDAIVAGDHAALRDEMGDVLLQVLFHAQLAQELPEDARWDVDDVAGDFVAKMIRRNPHVFADTPVADVDEIIANWERVKSEERVRRSPIEGVSWSLPALALAAKLLVKARRHGLPEPQPTDTLGGKLFALVAGAGPDADPEAALRAELHRYAEALHPDS